MKQNKKSGRKNQIGAYGEEIAANYYRKQGFTILDTNYLKKWGEIDIVARGTTQNSHKVHFIEVKTVSHETKNALKEAVARGTWRPEENVHAKKLQKLQRAIESWLEEHNYEGSWQIDVAAVRIVSNERFATIKVLDNVII